MEPLIAGMMLGHKLEARKNLKTTVLHRKGGTWSELDISRLVNGLMTETSQSPAKPEHIILYGHHTKEQTLEALLGGRAYTATQVTGMDSPELPFPPTFLER